MKIFKFVFVVLFMALILIVSTRVSLAQDLDIKIIANKSIKTDTVGAKFLEKLYLGKAKKWSDGTKAIAIVFKEEPSYEKFLDKYVKKSVSKFSNHWKKLIFTGRGIPPKEFQKAEKVVEYIKNHPGSIGYVTGDVDTSGVKIIIVE